MPRFTKPTISAEHIIKQLHKAIYYKDIDAIMFLWLDEDQISYIANDGRLYSGIAQIKYAFEQAVLSTQYTEIVKVYTHTLMGCVFVETIEAHKESDSEQEAIAYQNVTYVLVQNHLGLRLMRMHTSISSSSDMAMINFDNANLH
jgi:SnoaL-like domain